jgi:hypothetical protein
MEALVWQSSLLDGVLEVAQCVSAINRRTRPCAEHQVPGIALPFVAGSEPGLDLAASVFA